MHATLAPPTNHRVCSVDCRACDTRTTNNHRGCSVDCRACDTRTTNNHRGCSVNCQACDARTTNNHRGCSVKCRACDARTTNIDYRPVWGSLRLAPNSYEFCILNVYLPSETTRLKTSITFVARTMETHAPSIVLKTRKCP